MGSADADRAAGRHEHDVAVQGAVEEPVEEAGNPLVELTHGLPAWMPVVDARPAGASPGAALGRDLDRDPSLVRSEAPLAERRRRPDLEPELRRKRLGSLNCPPEVAGVQ